MPRRTVILLNLRALAVGVVVAVVLVSAYTWFGWAPGGMLAPLDAARFAAAYSAMIALLLLVFCIPVWLIFERLGWARWPVAIGLGFIAPLVYCFLDALGGGETFVRGDTFAYALCGAAAGLATWLTRAKRGQGTR